MMTLDVNLGQVIEAVVFAGSVLWAHQQMTARVDAFLDTMKRHETRLAVHDERLNEHGEKIAALDSVVLRR